MLLPALINRDNGRIDWLSALDYFEFKVGEFGNYLAEMLVGQLEIRAEIDSDDG